ncbi:hypothetical protein ABZM97_20455 [Bacillus vallismortis]|nr:hypothetical protein [Bacillus sp. RHFS10]
MTRIESRTGKEETYEK